MLCALRDDHPAPRRRVWTPLLVLLVLALVPACDNPACVFGPNGCQDRDEGGGDSLGSLPASTPSNGSWIQSGSPVVQAMAPSGTAAHPATPIVIRFSESLASGSLGGGFEVIETTFGAPVPVLEPPPLVGDGRLVVLSPLTPLQLGSTYLVRFREGAQVTDLTGQLVSQGISPDIGNFSVAATEPTTPDVIATFPPDLTEDQSDLGEVVVVFDRPMNPLTFDTSSFAVRVDGAPPPNNPAPVPLTVFAGPVPVTIESVWRWASVDGDGQRVSLGASGAVRVDLSPAGDKLADDDGNQLPATVLEYDIAPVAVPLAARKATLSDPDDAIGRPNLNDVVPVLEVELSAATQAGDVLDLYLFGTSTGGTQLRARSRSISVPGGTLLIDVMPGDLDLLQGGANSDGIFADGTLHVAARLRRNGLRTTVRLADVEPDRAGAQPLLFDVTAPTLVGLGASGKVTTSFRSDLRDLVVVGRGNEEIRRVEVTTDAGGDNLASPEAILSAGSGLFVASPVPVGATGVLDPRAPALQYTVRVFDRALNPQQGSATGSFRQLGTVGPGVGTPVSGPVDVFVYEEGTLAPLQGALVFSHQDASGTVTHVDTMSTDAAGYAAVISGASGTRTLITVDLAGYDLFTFYAVPRDVLQVPLVRTNRAGATTEGVVTTPFPTANVTPFTNQIADARRADDQERLFPVDSCSVLANQLIYSCPFGDETVLPRRLGAQSFLSADFSVSQGSFSAGAFLKAFALRAPSAPLGPDGQELSVLIPIDDLLANLDPEEQALAAPPTTLVDDDLGDLGSPAGDPVVTVEGFSPGLHDGLAVGLAAPFDVGGGDWELLGAYAGAADGIDDGGGDELGELVQQGTIEADLLLRAEVVGAGGRSGRRSRFSALAGTLSPVDVPSLVSPPPGGNTGGPAFELVACDRLPNALGMGGLHRFVLRDSPGRRWVLWRLDASGGDAGSGACVPGATVQVPDIGAVGGSPLANGPLSLRISSFAWPGLSPGAGFLWSDVERSQAVFAHTASIALSQP